MLTDGMIKQAVEEHGTPLEISSAQILALNVDRARGILARYGWQDNIFYSYKTNPVPEALRVLHQKGAWAEVISERELNLALSLGVPPDRIVFNGIYKSPAALKTAVERRIKCINIDAPQELDLLNGLAKSSENKIPVGLRVRPSVGWQGQFGYVIKDGSALAMARSIAANDKLNLVAVHFHLGASTGKIYRLAISEAMALIREMNSKLGIKVRALDIGGGFPGKDMRQLTLWEQGWLRLFGKPWPASVTGPNDGFEVLDKAVRHFWEAKDGFADEFGLDKLELWIEPGRLITGDAQVLAVKVIGLRKSGRRNYAIVDGGRVGAAGPLVGETRKVSVVGKEEGPIGIYDVVGPTCMPWDRLFAGVRLPRLDVGDIICVHGAGAYFVPMETEFSFDRPKAVIIG